LAGFICKYQARLLGRNAGRIGQEIRLVDSDDGGWVHQGWRPRPPVASRSPDRGAQNLPGNWTSSKFNLPLILHDMIPVIGDHETSIVMHNDAVVQGLSEIPFMQDVEHWGVLTVGTGLGNAQFTNRRAPDE
jgi:hypothetical protein